MAGPKRASKKPKAEHASLSKGQKRWILAATVLGSALTFIDGSALGVALPSIQNDLGAGPAEALNHLLVVHGDFVVDKTMEKYGFSLNPGGYLKRVK